MDEASPHCVRPDDIVARTGGDEFTVIMLTRIENAVRRADVATYSARRQGKAGWAMDPGLGPPTHAV